MSKRAKPGASQRPFASLAARRASLPNAPPPLPQRTPAPVPQAAQTLSDDALFLQAMADAQALPSGARQPTVARLNRPVYRPSDDDLALAELSNLCEGHGTFRTHESEEDFFGAAPGVSHTLLDNLRKGFYAVQQAIDLHGMTREQAHRALASFISHARCREGASCVLVVTGRGRSSPAGLSVLRQSLPRWLSRAPVRPHVLAYATARPVDGGPGAFYVLLRRQGMAPFAGPTSC